MAERDADIGAGGPCPHGRKWEREEIQNLNVDQLLELAAQAHIDGRSRMGKDELLDALTGRRT